MNAVRYTYARKKGRREREDILKEDGKVIKWVKVVEEKKKEMTTGEKN